LLGFIRHRGLALGHAGRQEGHIKATRQVTVGDPVREQKHLVSRQREMVLGALVQEGGLAVQFGNVGGIGVRAIGATCQQNAQFLKAFADGGHGLCEVLISLGRAAPGQGLSVRVSGVDDATRKNIGAGRKAGGHGAARHQHLQPLGSVSQQQNGGGGARGGGRARGVKAL